MASIYVEAQSSSSILAYLYNLSSVGESGRTVEWYLNNSYVGYDSLGTSDSTTNNFIFDGLAANTTYTITGKVFVDGYVVESKSTTCTTLSGSGSDLTEWEIFDTRSALNMEDQYEISYVINEYQVNRIKMSFVEDGEITIYAYSNDGCCLTLSYESSIDSELGYPESYEAQDYNRNGGSVEFTYDVVAGDVYYLYTSNYSASTSGGSVDVKITPPGVVANAPSWDSVDSIEQLSGTTYTVLIHGLDPDFTGQWYFSYTLTDVTNSELVDSNGDIAFTPEYNSTYGYWIAYQKAGLTRGSTYALNIGVGYAGTDGDIIYETFNFDFTVEGESVDVSSAYIDISDKTGTSLTVKIKGLDTSYSRNDRYIYWSIDGAERPSVSLGAGVTESDTYTFSNLNPCTSYTIGAKISYTSDGTSLTKVLEDKQFSTGWKTSWQSGFGTISSSTSVSWTLSSATICYTSVKFSTSGTVTFYTSGSTDTKGYLSTTTAFDNTNGYPSAILKEDDDSAGNYNFKFTYSVTAGTTYYIWVRGYDTSTAGSTTLNIDLSAGRPALFNWTDDGDVDGEKVQGGAYNLTAASWCDLLDNINEVRSYCGYSTYSSGSLSTNYTVFTYPKIGDTFTYMHYNQALMAIATIYSNKLGVSGVFDSNAVTKNSPVTAACLNVLRNLLNDL